VNALITEPGFYPQLTPDQYFAEPCPEPALTNSGISTLLKSCPAKFAHQHPAIGQPPEDRKDTAATHMGSLVHRLALDKGDDYVVSPHEAYRSAEAKAWKAEVEASGRVPVKQSALDDAEKMASVIRASIVEQTRGEPYETEVVFAWRRGSRWCRGMLDVWCPSLLLALDVKTCAAADDAAIDRAFANGYARQEAWYLEGINAITEAQGRARFGFLFVEKDPPFLPRFAEATESIRHGSRFEIARAWHQFNAGIETGEWPGYAPRKVNPTSWQLREWAEAEFAEAA
jgi:hypothetical protein